MNFWKDPKYCSMRVILLLIVIAGAVWFVVSNMHLSNSNQGRVININQVPTAAPKTPGGANVMGVYPYSTSENSAAGHGCRSDALGWCPALNKCVYGIWPTETVCNGGGQQTGGQGGNVH